MPFEFDPVNKLIKILAGTGSPLPALTIYNMVMDWTDSQEAMGYTVPMSAVGKAPLGGGVYTDSVFILQDGWKIKLYNGTYQFIIVGTVITDDESPRTVPPDSGNVEVIFQVSSQGTVIPDVAEWTQSEKSGVIVKVNTIPPDLAEIPTSQELDIDHGSGSWEGATPTQVWVHPERDLTTRKISGDSEEIAEEATLEDLKDTVAELRQLVRVLKREI